MNQKSLPAVAADVLGLIIFIALSAPFLSERLQTPTVSGGSILFFVFLFVAFGMNRIKRLEPVSGDAQSWIGRFDFTGNQRNMILLALTFVFAFVLMQTEMNNIWGDTVNLFENTGEVHEGEMTLYITFGPIFIWFIASAIYLIGFALPTDRSIAAEEKGYAITEFVALLLMNLLIGFYALYFSGWIGRMSPSAGDIVTFLATLIILELLFIPMRLRHSFKNPQIASIISFFMMLLSIVFLVF
ncbi:MAG: hypothetical protein ACI9EW_002258 [Cellvibrionaceae bacterium]|jgi:hypothetical protein